MKTTNDNRWIKLTPKAIFDELVHTAVFRRCLISNPDDRAMERHRFYGSPLPDRTLPGRLLDDLSPEQRAVLAQLTASMTEDRDDYVKNKSP